jgi:hypothetical protein
MTSSAKASSVSVRLSSVAGAVIAAGAVLLWAGVCRAQGFGPDPFQPYNSQFAPFVYPVAPGPLDYGHNFGPANIGVRGANQFESYLNSLRGFGGTSRMGVGSGSGAGTPYFRANRAYDKQFDRIYQPNREADAKFDTNQETVTEKYFRYLREKDPKRRAELFREYTRARNLADRQLASSRLGSAPRLSTRSTRTEGRAARPSTGTGTRDRDFFSTPPPATAGSSRTRGRSGTESSTSPLGPAPSPSGNVGDEGRTSRDATPSRVLERALRSDPSLGVPKPKPRMPAADSLGPAPPP